MIISDKIKTENDYFMTRSSNMKGEILKKLRKERGLSQLELSKKMKVTQSTIASLETGRREASNELMINLANFFNVSLDYLNGLTDNRNGNDTEVVKSEGLVRDLLIHLYKSGLIKDINNIDDTTKDIIMSMVKKELELISKNK
ncbi:helix-turn-helix transcriptional regulator [Clostridium sp.]|uniref:helix-turn-helix domain-containing protein n=1 Tax=Clostridium sp. TaxID=1506 RepID=UPI00290CA1AC|nr:helix-turn-helix transcriptional regulator [Clostridium sp.]MDU3526583.1 helix-turn-helix transcriptional regulator [Clostridium sp.]